MMAKIENRDYPNEPMCGPNLWRRKSGDRLAWVGEDRPERRSRNGILAILDCQYAVLAVGKEDRGGLEEFIGFGRPTAQDMKPGDVVRCRAAVKVVKELGIPRTWAPEW